MGTITFSTSWSATTTQNYILIVDTTGIASGDHVRLQLQRSSITATGDQIGGSVGILGSATAAQHVKGTAAAAGAIGGDVPEGEDRGGGGAGGGGSIDSNSGGTVLGDEPGYSAPTTNGSPQNGWTTGGNGYNSDGSYATAAEANLRQSYGNFGFAIPGGNTVNGIEVKLEAAGTSAAGTIEVTLSWNNGVSSTSKKTTATLTGTDAVYTLGGPADLWGRSWTQAELADGTFSIEVVSQPNNNSVKIDAIRVRVYHHAGGGGGGGGGEVAGPPTRFFAAAPASQAAQNDYLNALAAILWKVYWL